MTPSPGEERKRVRDPLLFSVSFPPPPPPLFSHPPPHLSAHCLQHIFYSTPPKKFHFFFPSTTRALDLVGLLRGTILPQGGGVGSCCPISSSCLVCAFHLLSRGRAATTAHCPPTHPPFTPPRFFDLARVQTSKCLSL